MPRQKSSGAPSAPSPLPSPSTLQPPQIIVLPTNESSDEMSISPTRRYGEERDMASQDQSNKGIDTDNDIESLKIWLKCNFYKFYSNIKRIFTSKLIAFLILTYGHSCEIFK